MCVGNIDILLLHKSGSKAKGIVNILSFRARGQSQIADIAVLNKMRYTPLATDALCPMPYALCPMPARAPHVTEKGYMLLVPLNSLQNEIKFEQEI
jgi:hypothetical protein